MASFRHNSKKGCLTEPEPEREEAGGKETGAEDSGEDLSSKEEVRQGVSHAYDYVYVMLQAA